MKPYISSNPTETEKLEAQIAEFQAQIQTAKADMATVKATSPAGKQHKSLIAACEKAIAKCRSELPHLLFSEVGALDELEATLAGRLADWQKSQADWLAMAAKNPLYAIEYSKSVVAAYAQADYYTKISNDWQEAQAGEGRSLATFRKVMDHNQKCLKREMMRRLTAGSSTNAFSNAIDHEFGKALVNLQEYGDWLLDKLTFFESDLEKYTERGHLA